MSNPDPFRNEPCPACGRKAYVPGSLLALLLFAVSPMLGGLLATLLDWWWLFTVTFAGWVAAAVILVVGIAASERQARR